MAPLKPSACFLSCIDGTAWGQQLNFFIFFAMIFRKHFNYCPGLFAPLPSWVKMELFVQGTCYPNPAGSSGQASSGFLLKFGECLLICFCDHHGKKLPVGWEIYMIQEKIPQAWGSTQQWKFSLVSPVTRGSICGDIWKVKLGGLDTECCPIFFHIVLKGGESKSVKYLVSEYLRWMKK